MAHYFVRRGEKVFGPVPGEQVVGLAKSGKVRATDEIATDKNGPWQPTTAMAPLKAAFGQTNVGPLGPTAADPLGIGPQHQAAEESEEGVPLGMSQFDVDRIRGRRTDEDAPPPKERKPLFKMPQKKILIITGTVFGVLLIGGLGTMFFLGGDDESTVAKAESSESTSSSSAPPKEGSWAAYAEAVGWTKTSKEGKWAIVVGILAVVALIAASLLAEPPEPLSDEELADHKQRARDRFKFFWG